MLDRRGLLLKSTQYIAGIMLLAVLYVSLDFLIDFKPSTIQSSYRFPLSDLPFDRPIWLKQDNLSILVIRRSEKLIDALKQSNDNLQDSKQHNARDVSRDLMTQLGIYCSEQAGYSVQL